ncbi:MAG: carboxyl-terminal processing protease [Clostridiales bacterium]|nr:carboxyl-terminal processing protease [Clostridiales bacterium]
MKKTYWAGFLSGVLCTMLLAFIGINVYQFRVNHAISQMTEEEGVSTQEVDTDSSKISTLSVLAKVTLLQKYIDTYYLNEIHGKELEDGIYKGIVEGLSDPYSVYYTKKEYDSLQESTTGVYYGIGARVSQDMDTGIITIVQPFEGGPAEQVGILPQDILYKIEGEEVTGEDLTSVVAKMKGEKGTKVTLTIIRDGKELEVSVTRNEIEVPTVSYKMLSNQIGYIQVTEFDEVTAKQYRAALEDLEKQGETALIVDLRNNGGGRLTAVVDMLDRMLPAGVIVSTKDKEGKGETYKSTDEEQFTKPLAVLINGNSASASEVFSGAIQDYGIGKLIGTTSFGKGIVQTIFGLNDGTAIKLTTSEYFTPKGRNIHGKGLTPDIEVELRDDLKKKITIPVEDDNQLQAAITELIKEQNKK